jgi:hypothetical protein
VAVVEVGPAGSRLGGGVVAVQVAIRLLRRSHQLDHLVGHTLELGVRAVAELPGQRL